MSLVLLILDNMPDNISYIYFAYTEYCIASTVASVVCIPHTICALCNSIYTLQELLEEDNKIDIVYRGEKMFNIILALLLL